MHRGWSWALVRVVAVALALGAGARTARAQDEEDVPVLPPVEIRAPRIEGGPGEAPPARAATPLRDDRPAFEVPASVTVIESAELTGRRLVRSMSDALLRLPSVLVQKTGPLQSSPFIRGFTGYNNVLLIDGVRLNHSAFRAGPNQYWSTVDPWSIERLEVVRGPHSVLYGSDAVGGTVNVIPKRRECFAPGFHWNARIIGRAASAESMGGGRLEVEGNAGRLGWLGGVSFRHYGDIESGGGRLPGTGGISDAAADLRFDHHLDPWWTLTLAAQHVSQRDAPRTEQTVDSVPFQGTAVGTDLQRDLDQDRNLVYARLAYDGQHTGGPVDRGSVTVSWHRHEEERDRIRTGARQEWQGFTLDQFGITAQLESRTRIGRLTYGVEYYHDEIDTFTRSTTGGVANPPVIQGPLGDDGSYDLLGVYLQDHIHVDRWDLYAGVRFTYARAEADRVDNPAVAGSSPATPGNIIRVQNDWTRVVGSLKGVYHVARGWNAYAGVSQAFRAPSLHDLTSLETTSVVESPAPDLKPEDYVSFEVGVKTEQKRFSGEAAVWYTDMTDAIIRSPTGVLIGGTPEVRKDNIGDGWAWGIELEGALRVGRPWTVFGNLSWMDSSVQELDAAGTSLVSSPVSREKPFTSLLGVRLEPPGSRLWAQGEWACSTRADDLSLRDLTDTRRIPPAGTPGWSVVNLRAGARLGRQSTLTLAVENVFDENYRIHGSGQNEAGRSLILGWSLDG